MISSQSSAWSLTSLLSAALRVLLSRSRCPFVCGWWADALWCSVCKFYISWSMMLFTNSRPWSLIKVSRQPSRHTTEYRNWATVFAVLSGIAAASDHLEKWSVTATMYLLPFVVSWRGPTMSIPTRLQIFSGTGIEFNEGASLLTFGFTTKHSVHTCAEDIFWKDSSKSAESVGTSYLPWWIISDNL